MNATNAELRSMMKQCLLDDHKLTRTVVATLAQVAGSTVDSWLLPQTSTYYRDMPERARRLLALELGLEKPVSSELKVEVRRR